MNTDDELVPLPIDGVLDLHTFRPCDVKEVVTEYLAECRARGVLRVRIVHGKGIGNLRRTVHALLARDLAVAEFHLAGGQSGGWGATIAHLKRPDSSP
jgi:DNA-nicking Smr family endonuclease